MGEHLDRERFRAHQLAFKLSGGKVTKELPQVLHSCATRRCCEPSHLRAGSHADNMRDVAMRNGARKKTTPLPLGVRKAPSGRFEGFFWSGRQRHVGTFDGWQEAAALAALGKNLDLFPEGIRP